jgi:ABC-type transport system involved in multi-copper enzyme maturation permease subunit
LSSSSVGLAFTAIVRSSLIQTIRTKATWGVLALVALLIWYDLNYRVPAAPLGWWATVGFAIGLVAALLGYDHYDRLRHEGILRPLLLHGAPRWVMVLGYAAAGLAPALVAVAVLLGYLASSSSGLPLVDLPRAVFGACCAAAAFLMFAQALSLLMPKDAAAVVVLLVLVLGSSPPSQWLPEGVSSWVSTFVSALWAVIPTPIVVARFLRGESGLAGLVLLVAQTILWYGLAVLGLHRQSLLARGES